MRNIVGKPVSGSDYFEREAITNRIYRRLDTGANLFLAAPRRVGKTSIMYYLQDHPREKYAFIYVNTEPIDETEEYFKRLFEGLLNSEAVTRTVKRSQKAKNLFERVTERVKKIGLFGVEIELDGRREGKYSEEFADLMRNLEPDGFAIVIMVDEFPSTVENIRKKHGEVSAIHFLKLNRAMRQESSDGIQFIYTGSIGLPAIVNRLDTPESINDLNEIEIPPLSEDEGRAFAKALLDNVKIPFEPAAIDYLLERVRWLMPFFIQISVQELIEEYESSNRPIDRAVVDAAFEKIVNRRNNIHFESYYQRLEAAFSENDYHVALQILNAVAGIEKLPEDALFVNVKSEEDTRRIRSILDTLEYDGYINRMNGSFRFNSPILQRWWNRYIPKTPKG